MSNNYLNRCWFNNTTSSGTGSIAVGTAYDNSYMTPAEAGAVEARQYTWCVMQGTDMQIVVGAYGTAGGAHVNRTTTLWCKIAGVVTTSGSLTLTGAGATVECVSAAEDQLGWEGVIASATTATTQSPGDNSSKVSTTAYADAIAALKANLASPTFTGSVTIGAGAGIASSGPGGTMTATAYAATGQLPATSTNDSAAAGNVGAYVFAIVNGTGAIALTTNVPVTVTSISLPAGDWDVRATGYITGAATTIVAYSNCSISQTNNALDPNPGALFAVGYASSANIYASVTPASLVVPPLRVSLNATTTLYLVVQSGFSVSTSTAYGFISARRPR